MPIAEIAKAIGKDAWYIRIGIQQGILKFGTAMKVGNSREYSYYCPDKKVWEETGYFNKNMWYYFCVRTVIYIHNEKMKK